MAAFDMLLRSTGRRRLQPWISYRATSELNVILHPEWRVLEFGAGMSTLWLAKRALFVLSIESNRDWYQWVCMQLKSRAITNVEVRLRQDPDSYAAAVHPQDGLFELVLIDGDWRARCVEPSLRAMSSEGLLYIDNIDAGGRDAAQQLLSAAPGVEVRYYTDLAPGVGAPTTGMLARIR